MQICIRAHDLKLKGEKNIINGLRHVGADGMQLVCYKSFEEVEYAKGSITQKRAEAIGDAFKEANLETVLLGAYFNPVHSDKDKVKRGVEIFKEYLSMSKLIGYNIVGSETGSYNDEPWIYHPKNRTDAALKETTDIFKELCDYADKYGAMVGIEGARGHVCFDVATLNKATRMIGSENLRIIFDLYNFMDVANYKNYLDILAQGLDVFEGRIHCFHIKDCVFGAECLKQCAVGMGDMDFDSILTMIRRYDENAILILEGTTGDEIYKSVGFVKEKWKNAKL